MSSKESWNKSSFDIYIFSAVNFLVIFFLLIFYVCSTILFPNIDSLDSIIDEEDMNSFFNIYFECKQDDVDCIQFLYPIWKQYKKMLISSRSPRRFNISKQNADSKMIYRHNPMSPIENVFIMNPSMNPPMHLLLDDAKYARIKEFGKRRGSNCGGGVYTQLSMVDSFPDSLVLKRCAPGSEVRKTLIVENSSFAPNVWAVSPSERCSECKHSPDHGDRVDVLMEYCGISIESIIDDHIRNKTRFKNILDQFLFEIMGHIHDTYNIWHCDVGYHNVFINERYELKIIDWELAMVHDQHKNKYPQCIHWNLQDTFIEGKMANLHI